MVVSDDGFHRRSLAEEVADGNYITIHDLLDSPPPLDGGSSSGGAREIRIKNRLVKRAAYAYLQPTHSMAEYNDRRRRRRRRSLRRAIDVLTCGLAGEPLLSCIDSFLRLFRRPPR